MPLSYCSKCKEKSVTVRITKCKDYIWSGKSRRVEYCINKGCGYRLNLGVVTNHIIYPEELAGAGQYMGDETLWR